MEKKIKVEGKETKIVGPDSTVNSYTQTSLQFNNSEGVNPWPRIFSGEADHVVLLSIMEDKKVVCEVDFDGYVKTMGGKTSDDVIKLIALILSYQRQDFFKHY